jgi:hypothetical protein
VRGGDAEELGVPRLRLEIGVERHMDVRVVGRLEVLTDDRQRVGIDAEVLADADGERRLSRRGVGDRLFEEALERRAEVACRQRLLFHGPDRRSTGVSGPS